MGEYSSRERNKVICGGGCLLLAALTALAARPAAAATATISWDPNKEPDVTGYQLHYALHAGPPYDGTFAAEGPSPIDIPLSIIANRSKPEFKLTVPSCTQFYVNLKAYNSAGLYSEFAGEISAKVPYRPTGVVTTAEENGLSVKWDPMPSNDTGSISYYLIYYDTDRPGEPYNGRGAAQGDSPFPLPLKALADPKAPQIRISGLESLPQIYVVVATACTTGEGRKSDEVSGRGIMASSPDPGNLSGCACRLGSQAGAGPQLMLLLLILLFAAAARLRARVGRRVEAQRPQSGPGGPLTGAKSLRT